MIDPRFAERLLAAPSTDDDAHVDEAAAEARERWRDGLRSRLARAMERLPRAEITALRMRAEGMRLVDVGAELGLSQALVSYHLARAEHRLRVLVQLPELEAAAVADALRSITPNPMRPWWADTLTDFWITANATTTARRLNLLPRTAARYVVDGLAVLQAAMSGRPDLELIHTGFAVIRSHGQRLLGSEPRPYGPRAQAAAKPTGGSR